MDLGKYFTLEELTVTRTGLANTPGEEEENNLRELVKNVLDPARKQLKEAITVTSGYRSESVNRRIGGAQNSQHKKGQAADIFCSDNAKLFGIIRGKLDFDQLIWEAGNDEQPAWIHVSYAGEKNRNQVLKMVRKDGKSTYITI